MTPLLAVYFTILSFLLGACIGSFLNVCIYRIPAEESVVRPGSRCGACRTPIKWYDNIPLVSYLVLRGKCRHCGAAYSVRYYVVEMLTGVLFLLVWNRYQLSALTPIYWLAVSGLVLGTFVDIDHQILPDRVTWGGIAVGLPLSALVPAMHGEVTWIGGLLRALIGAAVGGGILFLVTEVGKLAFGRLKIDLPEKSVVTLKGGLLAFEAPAEKLRPVFYRLCLRLRLLVRRAGPTCWSWRRRLKALARRARPAPVRPASAEKIPWEEIFYRLSDRVRLRAATLKFRDRTFENVEVALSETVLTVDGTDYSLAEAGDLEATTDQLILPREAMGFGDVKLMGAIGAFLGWKAAVFTLIASAFGGTLVGLGLIALGKKDLQGRIPYGPYLALAAVVWILGGDHLARAYQHWLAMPM